MAPADYSGITLQVGQERTVNITVQPAAVATEVQVSGGDLAVVVAQLPINGRQVSQVYLMAPGAANFGGWNLR